MNVHLSSVYGPPMDVDFAEMDFPVVIGRGSDADLSIDDRWVSRVHCVLSLSQGRLFVRDLESKHGTYVNEQHVDSTELLPDDRLDIGLTTFVVELDSADSVVHLRDQ